MLNGLCSRLHSSLQPEREIQEPGTAQVLINPCGCLVCLRLQLGECSRPSPSVSRSWAPCCSLRKTSGWRLSAPVGFLLPIAIALVLPPPTVWERWTSTLHQDPSACGRASDPQFRVLMQGVCLQKVIYHNLCSPTLPPPSERLYRGHQNHTGLHLLASPTFPSFWSSLGKLCDFGHGP